MKIVIPSSTFSYIIGGGEKILLRQTEYLLQYGHQVSILTLKSPQGKESFLYQNFRKKKHTNFEVIEFDIPSRYKQLYKQIGTPDRHYWDTQALYFNELIYPTIVKISPDIIFSHYILYGLFKPSNISNVLYLLGYTNEVQEIRKVFFRFYDHIISISSIVKDKWSRYIEPSQNHSVLNSGVNLETPQEKINTDRKFNLVFLGRVIERKGIETLLQALKTVTLKEKDIHLWIVGDGPYKTKAESLVDSLGLGQFVTFVGFSDKPYTFFQSADICIFPSYEKDGLMGVVLEAMAEGAPIITTTDNGNEDVIESGVNGLLIKPRDPESLTEAILRLLSDNNFREKIGSNAKKYAQENLSWTNHIEILIRIFESTIKSKDKLNKFN